MKKMNIVWFEIDSLRPDFLYVNGDPDAKENFLDRLIKRGAFFSKCITAAPFTISSETSTFTSLYPNIHKLDGWFKTSPKFLAKNVVSFADILKSEGYFNACYYSCTTRAYVPPYSFDKYELLSPDIEFPLLPFQNAQSPKFLFISYADIHDDCVQNQGYFTKEKYRQAVSRIAAKMENVYNRYCGESDIIIVASDHGVRCTDEPDGGHHEFVTGRYLTDKTIKVCFSVVAPGIVPSGIKIDNMVRTIDIVPTILDVAGLMQFYAQGRSVASFLRGVRESDRGAPYAFTQTGGMVTSPWKPDTWSVRTPQWKFVLTAQDSSPKVVYRKELFDLCKDPHELVNVVEYNQSIAIKLEKEIYNEILTNRHLPEYYYRINAFDYKRILRSRIYPLKIRLKILLRNFIYRNLNRTFVRLKLFLKKLVPISWI